MKKLKVKQTLKKKRRNEAGLAAGQLPCVAS